MLDRAKLLKILVQSNRRSLEQIELALETLESGISQLTSYSIIQRAFHTMKHDALHVQLTRLASLCEAAERIVERAHEQKLGLPLPLLRAAAQEVRSATDTVAAGGTHQLNGELLARLQEQARTGLADSPD